MSSENGILNDRDSGWLAGQLQQLAEAAFSEQMRAYSPAYRLRPRLSIDGNQWCALLGEDLQSGVCGFGDSPAAAYDDFNREWFKGIKK